MAVIPSPDKLTAVDVARMMLESGANPNIQLKRRPPYRDVPQDRGGDTMLAQGATPLLRAARGGDDKFVALLLEYKALVDLPSKEGITPLMAAAGVDYGARVTRGRNRTDEGVLATMDLLIKAGANVNARSVLDPRTPSGSSLSVLPPELEAAVRLLPRRPRQRALGLRNTAPPPIARPSAAAVKCRARTPSRTKPLCTAPPNTASISSSNSSSPTAPT